MNKNSIPSIRFFTKLLAATAALFLAGTAQAATVTRTVLNDGSTVALFHPAAAVGPNGNIHIVAQGITVGASTFNQSTTEIYYLLLSPSGQKLIDASVVNTPDAVKEGRPAIAVTSTNKAVITWFRSGEVLRYVLIDPSLDTSLDGGPLAAAAIVRPETVVGTNTSNGHHALALDSNNIAHVVTSQSGARYIAFNPATGAVVNAETALWASGQNNTIPAMSIDSLGNVHVVGSNCTINGNCPATYEMLGNNGVVKIAPTQLYDAAAISPHAAHFSVMVDSGNKVHIVYGDKRNTVDANNYCTACSQGGTMIYTELNPALHPQDGTAATMSAIRVGSETEMANAWYGRAFLNSGSINLFTTGKSGGDITHTAVAAGGGTPLEPRVIHAQDEGFTWSRPYVTSAGNNVMWSEGVYSPTLVGGTLQLVMAGLSGFTARPSTVGNSDSKNFWGCSLNSGTGPVDPLFPLLVALSGVYLLRRRMRSADL